MYAISLMVIGGLSMNDTVSLFRPEMKHGEADAIRSNNTNIEDTFLYRMIVDTIKGSKACNEFVPITLFGVSTREYCIIPCPVPETDSIVSRVIAYIKGQGWYSELYHISASRGNPHKYNCCIVVSWDPKVLAKSMSPRYYCSKDGIKVPCGVCQKSKTGEVGECNGCITFRLWLAGAYVMKNYGDPCKKCLKGCTKNKVECVRCPAKDLWCELYEDEASNEDVGE